MTDTKAWAASLDICIDASVPAVEGYSTAYSARTVSEVAIRTVILQCVAAVGFGVNPAPVISWLRAEGLWDQVSPQERHLLSSEELSDQDRIGAQWRQEAQWALLWVIGRVESIGLPTSTCDTRRVVDEIMPALGGPVAPFVEAAVFRQPAELLAEIDRVYDLHCYARPAYREGRLPADLIYSVLYQRHYAFAWFEGEDDWDHVSVDT